MGGLSRKTRALFLSGVAVAAVAVIVATSGGSHRRSAAPATPIPLATYVERYPHVSSRLDVYGLVGGVRGAPTVPQPEAAPLDPATFAGPESAYLRYSERQLAAMQAQLGPLRSALAAGERATAQARWRAAYADYLGLGAVYLEGPVAALNQAIDGTPGGLPGGSASLRFTGLHRVEMGLWSSAPLAQLTPVVTKLAGDAANLATLLPSVSIPAADYATRAHEILEDAVRDQLSGTDVPWSGEGVLGTVAGFDATTEVVSTLEPLLRSTEAEPAVSSGLQALSRVIAGIQRAHGGVLPPNQGLSQPESERLDAAIGGALEALAQVPGALETAISREPKQLPSSASRIVH
jgi:iron uptake system EfeUOB component EfeO/EfeM